MRMRHDHQPGQKNPAHQADEIGAAPGLIELRGPKNHNGQQKGDQPQGLEDQAKGFPIDPADEDQHQYHHDPVQEPLQPG